MTKSQATALVYGGGLIGFSSLVVSAYFYKEYRLVLLLSAFAILGLAYASETILFRRRPSSVQARRTWIDVGMMSIPGTLAVDDKWKLSTSQSIKALPPGRYGIGVEQFRKGSDHYVAALTIKAEHPTGECANLRLRINCETGFIIFVACDATAQVLEAVRKAQDSILNDIARTVDVELVYRDSGVVGVVAAAGLGNGQYDLEVTEATQALNIRFIEDLGEI